MRIIFNTPPLGAEHWPEISKIAGMTIKNSLSEKMRKEFTDVVNDVEPEKAFGMAEIVGITGKGFISPYLLKEKELPSDVTDFLWNCFWGSYEFYCKEKGLLNK